MVGHAAMPSLREMLISLPFTPIVTIVVAVRAAGEVRADRRPRQRRGPVERNTLLRGA